MFTPRAVFQELAKGHCYTIYQDPNSGQFYLMVDTTVYRESGQVFKSEISIVFQKLVLLKEQQKSPGKFPHH